MARAQKTSRRPKRDHTESVEADIKAALTREFDDWVITRSAPDPTNRRARENYTGALRRLASVRHGWGVEGPSWIDPSDADGQTLFHHDLLKLARTHAGKISPESVLPARRAVGLYDYHPPRLPAPHAFGEPFSLPFMFSNDTPPKSAIMICAPQVDSGMFYSSVTALSTPTDRTAKAWCGTFITIDPKLHDAAHGPKDVVVWAEGTIGYDYTLEASPGPRWNSKPEAALAGVDVMARLVRYNRQTNKLVVGADGGFAAYLAARPILIAKLVPNGQTTAPPSSSAPVVGGSYATWTTWTSGQVPFHLDLSNGLPRMLSTDSFYYVAVLCAAGLDARSVGQGPGDTAQANVSAQMFLRLVTLGIRPHDPKVVL